MDLRSSVHMLLCTLTPTSFPVTFLLSGSGTGGVLGPICHANHCDRLQVAFLPSGALQQGGNVLDYYRFGFRSQKNCTSSTLFDYLHERVVPCWLMSVIKGLMYTVVSHPSHAIGIRMPCLAPAPTFELSHLPFPRLRRP